MAAKSESRMQTRSSDCTNMATTPLYQIVKPPDRYTKGDDINVFIKQLANYFEMLQTTAEQQKLLLPAFLSPELVDRYKRATVTSPDDWKASLKKAFDKPVTLEQRLRDALSIDSDNMPIEDLLEKVEETTDQILQFKLDRATIFRTILMAALKDPEMKKEVIIKPEADVPTMKANLVAVEEIRRQIQPDLVSYAQVVRSPPRRPIQPTRKTVPVSSYKPVRCFNCNREGHLSRNCRERWSNVRERVDRRSDQKDSRRCFACKEIGHIRRDCPNVRCQLCKKNGHFRHQCLMRNRNDIKFKRANAISEDEPNDEQIENDDVDLNDNAPLFGDMVGAISVK